MLNPHAGGAGPGIYWRPPPILWFCEVQALEEEKSAVSISDEGSQGYEGPHLNPRANIHQLMMLGTGHSGINCMAMENEFILLSLKQIWNLKKIMPKSKMWCRILKTKTSRGVISQAPFPALLPNLSNCFIMFHGYSEQRNLKAHFSQ